MFQSTPAPIGAGDTMVQASKLIDALFQSTPAPIGAGDRSGASPA